jgi:hypothetical protein
MEKIKEGSSVKYIGETNDYTYSKDIYKNSIGIVKTVFEAEGEETFQVEFENGILASIDLNELEKIK